MAKYDVPKIKYNLTPEEKAIQELIDMKYRSPIEIISQDVQTKFEDLVMNTVYSYEIKVDKDELIKALQYDRDQYRQGFKDACGAVFDKLKSLLAQDIFKDIENIINTNYNKHIFGDNDLDDIEHDAIINFSDDISSDLEELKKKYKVCDGNCQRCDQAIWDRSTSFVGENRIVSCEWKESEDNP